MAIPDFETIMLPLLKLIYDGNEKTHQECVDILSNQFNLTQSDREQRTPSGGQSLFYNRVGWAKSYLKKAGLLETPKRGVVRITDRGLKVLDDSPDQIDVSYLMQFEEFREFQNSQRVYPLKTKK